MNQNLPTNNQDDRKICIVKDPVNQNCVFDNFIAGDCNQIALSLALAIAENPSITIHNPLVIYSKTGLGKSHLLQAIVNKIRDDNTKYKVVYLRSESFCSHLVNAIRSNSYNKFLRYFSRQDMLVMDDLNCFRGKPKTQEYLIRIIEQFIRHGKQVIISTSATPTELKEIDGGLLSLMSMGMVVELTIPDSDTIVKILKQKAKQLSVDIPESILKTLSLMSWSGIREMEGILIMLVAKALSEKKEVSIELLDTLKIHI